MKWRFLLCLTAALPLLTACQGGKGTEPEKEESKAPSEYIRMRIEGGWRVDGNIWIYPDGTYRIRYYDAVTGDIKMDRKGTNPGLYQRIVALVDSLDGWDISTYSLDKQIREEKKRNDMGAVGIMDVDHTFIEIRADNPFRVLRADSRGAPFMVDTFPESTQLADYAKIEAAVFEGTSPHVED